MARFSKGGRAGFQKTVLAVTSFQALAILLVLFWFGGLATKLSRRGQRAAPTPFPTSDSDAAASCPPLEIKQPPADCTVYSSVCVDQGVLVLHNSSLAPDKREAWQLQFWAPERYYNFLWPAHVATPGLNSDILKPCGTVGRDPTSMLLHLYACPPNPNPHPARCV